MLFWLDSTPDTGDVVLVGSNNKTYELPLGRIVELIPGKDGKVRVANAKTRQGIFTMPFQQLYPLEEHSSQASRKNGTEVIQDKNQSLETK